MRKKPFRRLLALVDRTYPEIEWEYTIYAGENRTGYSWAQMRSGDVPDIFISSQIIDKDLAKERLVDLANYDFVNTALLDQAAIDGGVYVPPVNNVMYGIYYNKTLMEEHGWVLPANFAEIREAGLEPGYIGTQLTGVPFAAIFNLAKTSWLTTPDGVSWEREFLAGNATAAGTWEDTMDYVQKYIDIGMFNTDPEDHSDGNVLKNFVDARKAVFCTSMQALRNGRAFLMTYVGWENDLSDMGQAYKDWLRGVDGMDGPGCIARMDELQNAYLNDLDAVYC